MISRCPSCAATIDEDAAKCPACQWDFRTRRRVAPGQERPVGDPAAAHGDVKPPSPVEPSRPLEVPPLEPIDLAAPPPEKAPGQWGGRGVGGRIVAATLTLILGALAWLKRDLIVAALGFSAGPEVKTIERVTVDPHSPVITVMPPPPAAEPAEPLPPEPAPALPQTAASPAPAPSPQVAGAAPKAKSAPWIFEGVAYDLVTLRPIYAARLVFIDPRGARKALVETAHDGRFRASVAPLGSGSYRVLVEHEDYRAFIDDIDPPFSQTDEESRLMAASTRGWRPWLGRAARVTRRDLVGIPKVLP